MFKGIQNQLSQPSQITRAFQTTTSAVKEGMYKTGAMLAGKIVKTVCSKSDTVKRLVQDMEVMFGVRLLNKKTLSERGTDDNPMKGMSGPIEDVSSSFKKDKQLDAMKEVAEVKPEVGMKPKTKKANEETKPRFGFGSTEEKQITGDNMTRAEYIHAWETKGPRRMADPRATDKTRPSKIPRANPKSLTEIKRKREQDQKQRAYSMEGLTAGEQKFKLEQNLRNSKDPWAEKTKRAAENPKREKVPKRDNSLKPARKTPKVGFGSHVPAQKKLVGSDAEIKEQFESNIRNVDVSNRRQ